MAGVSLSDRQRLEWLRLLRSESIGPISFRNLTNRFGGAGAALEALPELARRSGRSVRLCGEDEALREIEGLARLGARFVALGEDDYPAALRAIDSAPPLIAVLGRGEVLRRPAVAIVGSRNASAAGLVFSQRLAREIGEAGFVVVSGLARGIDAAAHEASRDTGTVAVLAGGLDEVYPPQNRPLLERIVERGAAISEMPLSWVPRGRDFPRRNRIVSGLALGTVVVEAGRRSGSLITARFANEQGRLVFAVPGSPLDPRAEGGNHLIREGALLCADSAHVVEALRPLVEGGLDRHHGQLRDEMRVPSRDEPLWDEFDLPGLEQAVPLAPVEEAPPPGGRAEEEQGPDLLALIGTAPVATDDLVRASGLAAREVVGRLLELELAGLVERQPGGAVTRRLGR